MEYPKIGFFEEAPNHKSSTRLFSFCLLVFFVIFNIIFLIKSECQISYDFIFYDFMLLVGVFAPKYLAKLAEMKLGTFEQPNKNKDK